MSPRGHCVEVTGNNPARLWTCDEFGLDQEWTPLVSGANSGANSGGQEWDFYW